MDWGKSKQTFATVTGLRQRFEIGNHQNPIQMSTYCVVRLANKIAYLFDTIIKVWDLTILTIIIQYITLNGSYEPTYSIKKFF